MTNKAMVSGYKDQALSIGIAGEQTNGQRYAVLGSNPFRTAQRFPDSSNAAMTQWLKTSLLGCQVELLQTSSSRKWISLITFLMSKRRAVG